MKSILVVLLFCLIAAVLSCVVNAGENFNPDKVHLVDYNAATNSFLFRGNEPTVEYSKDNITFAYDQVVSTMAAKAAAFNITTFPALNSGKKLYIVDISYQQIFEYGVLEEAEYFKANPSLGEFKLWSLLGDIIEPQWVSPADRIKFLENGTIWKGNDIIDRVHKDHAMLQAGPPPGYDALAIYGHCSAGCDRTGCAMMNYEMQFAPKYTNGRFSNFSSLYKQNCGSSYGCGRCSNYFGSNCAAWGCLYFNYFNASQLGLPPLSDCLSAFQCQLFKNCEPTN